MQRQKVMQSSIQYMFNISLMKLKFARLTNGHRTLTCKCTTFDSRRPTGGQLYASTLCSVIMHYATTDARLGFYMSEIFPDLVSCASYGFKTKVFDTILMVHEVTPSKQ